MTRVRCTLVEGRPGVASQMINHIYERILLTQVYLALKSDTSQCTVKNTLVVETQTIRRRTNCFYSQHVFEAMEAGLDKDHRSKLKR